MNSVACGRVYIEPHLEYKAAPVRTRCRIHIAHYSSVSAASSAVRPYARNSDKIHDGKQWKITMTFITNLEKLLATGQDSAMLRFSLGKAYLETGNVTMAISHLAKALQQDPHYSAAWKLYAQSLAKVDQTTAAITAYQQGISVAEQHGDKQAAKEMRVFLQRLQKLSGANNG